MNRERETPFILVSAFDDPGLLARAEVAPVLAYLVKPIKQADLKTAIGLAMTRFEHFQALRRETSDLRQALEDRKAIEQAKGVLMKNAAVDEQEAFRRLRQLARDSNRKMVEIARTVLLAGQAFQPEGG